MPTNPERARRSTVLMYKLQDTPEIGPPMGKPPTCRETLPARSMNNTTQHKRNSSTKVSADMRKRGTKSAACNAYISWMTSREGSTGVLVNIDSMSKEANTNPGGIDVRRSQSRSWSTKAKESRKVEVESVRSSNAWRMGTSRRCKA